MEHEMEPWVMYGVYTVWASLRVKGLGSGELSNNGVTCKMTWKLPYYSELMFRGT